MAGCLAAILSSVRAAPLGWMVPRSHLRTVPRETSTQSLWDWHDRAVTPPHRREPPVAIPVPPDTVRNLTFSLFLGLIFAFILPSLKRNIIERKKEMIRELTHTAWSELASSHRLEAEGALSRESAQQTAIERVRAMRYGKDRKDYLSGRG
jgi:hypothetical protein